MSSASTEHRPVVTIAALYGAGGTVIGPRVAKRLGVRCLNREIPESVAKRAGLPEQAVFEVDQKPQSRMKRLLASLGRASGVFGTAGPAERLDLQERQLRAYIEEFLAQATGQGGVAIG
jgi:hypothetical protein